jgi:DNA-binding HxlR family transcriptional regulator
MSDRPRSPGSNERQSEPRPQNGPRRATTNRKDSARQLVRLVAARCTLLILAELSHEGRRYQDLHEALDGVSYKVLTETLRRAERDGLVARGLDHASVETAKR